MSDRAAINAARPAPRLKAPGGPIVIIHVGLLASLALANVGALAQTCEQESCLGMQASILFGVPDLLFTLIGLSIATGSGRASPLLISDTAVAGTFWLAMIGSGPITWLAAASAMLLALIGMVLTGSQVASHRVERLVTIAVLVTVALGIWASVGSYLTGVAVLAALAAALLAADGLIGWLWLRSRSGPMGGVAPRRPGRGPNVERALAERRSISLPGADPSESSDDGS